MKFETFIIPALFSLSVTASGLEKRQSASTTENPTEASVLSVLATALPPSLLAIGITNAPEVGSIIASSFSAGQTPAWYSALPEDVKSYLPILYSEQAPTTPVPSVQASISASISSSLNTTTISSVHSASLKATTTEASSVAGSASSAGASSTSSGGASYPSAVVGAGVAGALGLLGMLAL